MVSGFTTGITWSFRSILQDGPQLDYTLTFIFPLTPHVYAIDISDSRMWLSRYMRILPACFIVYPRNGTFLTVYWISMLEKLRS